MQSIPKLPQKAVGNDAPCMFKHDGYSMGKESRRFSEYRQSSIENQYILCTTRTGIGPSSVCPHKGCSTRYPFVVRCFLLPKKPAPLRQVKSVIPTPLCFTSFSCAPLGVMLCYISLRISSQRPRALRVAGSGNPRSITVWMYLDPEFASSRVEPCVATI